VIEFITKSLIKWCERTGRTLHITGTGGPDDVYLVRYYVFQSNRFNVFIHRFMRSDRDDLHDHPWDFATYLVSGAYTEKRWDHKEQDVVYTHRLNLEDVGYGPEKMNRLVFRKAEDQHMVMTDREYAMSEIEQAPLTICVTGRTRREWGFVSESNCQGRTWIPWRRYLGLPEDEPGRG